jgi:hypothetical protein
MHRHSSENVLGRLWDERCSIERSAMVALQSSPTQVPKLLCYHGFYESEPVKRDILHHAILLKVK